MVIFFNKYTETALFSGAPEFIPVFSVIRVALSFSFLFSVLYILFVLLSICLLHCLSFDLKISITPFGISKLFLYFTSYVDVQSSFHFFTIYIFNEKIVQRM